MGSATNHDTSDPRAAVFRLLYIESSVLTIRIFQACSTGVHKNVISVSLIDPGFFQVQVLHNVSQTLPLDARFDLIDKISNRIKRADTGCKHTLMPVQEDRVT